MTSEIRQQGHKPSGVPGRSALAAAMAVALLAPVPSWADSPSFPIYGVWAEIEMILGRIGVPLTCATVPASASQLNTGRVDENGDLVGGMQSSPMGWDTSFPAGYSGTPQDDIPMRGSFALPVAEAHRDPDWADPPRGSQWVGAMWGNELPPASDSESGETRFVSAYMGGWYIDTAADAARMRVRVTYRAEDQLVGIYLNKLDSPNLLTTPITRDTSSMGTKPGIVELSGFQPGENVLTFVVHSFQQPPEEHNHLGFAAAFDAHCFDPKPVPTLGEWGLMLMGLLAAGLGMRRLRRT